MFAALLARQQPRVAQLAARRFQSTASQQVLKGDKTVGNKFLEERAHVEKHAADSAELWRKLSIYATIPFLTIAGINAYTLWNEHWEHWAHMPPLEERTEYSYQNIRTKNFFWGDGDKTIFWNPSVNYHKTD